MPAVEVFGNEVEDPTENVRALLQAELFGEVTVEPDVCDASIQVNRLGAVARVLGELGEDCRSKAQERGFVRKEGGDASASLDLAPQSLKQVARAEPTASAGAILCAVRLRGKLNGEMNEHGPMGTRFHMPE